MQRTTVAPDDRHIGTKAVPESPEAVIYVVDDDAAVRAAVCLLVEAHGWQARPLASPEEFLLHYDRLRPGCLVLDLRMPEPGMSPLALQDIISNLGLPLEIIVVTAYAGHPLEARARAGGALQVLTKPFREEELIASIRAALDPLH